MPERSSIARKHDDVDHHHPPDHAPSLSGLLIAGSLAWTGGAGYAETENPIFLLGFVLFLASFLWAGREQQQRGRNAYDKYTL